MICQDDANDDKTSSARCNNNLPDLPVPDPTDAQTTQTPCPGQTIEISTKLMMIVLIKVDDGSHDDDYHLIMSLKFLFSRMHKMLQLRLQARWAGRRNGIIGWRPILQWWASSYQLYHSNFVFRFCHRRKCYLMWQG